MPEYLQQDVSDAYLQGLVGAYRQGFEAMGQRPPSGDQQVIDILEAYGITKRAGADMAGRFDAIPSDTTHPDQ